MIPSRESGASLLAMVMILLLLGMLTVGALNRQMMAAARFNSEERRYFQAYNQAASALSWGTLCKWLFPANGWRCRSPAGADFTACIRDSGEPGIILLRGESAVRVGQQPIRLYRRLHWPRQAWLTELALIPDQRGWLDFCPLRQSALCTE